MCLDAERHCRLFYRRLGDRHVTLATLLDPFRLFIGIQSFDVYPVLVKNWICKGNWKNNSQRTVKIS
jgi:hypothetical protein